VQLIQTQHAKYLHHFKSVRQVHSRQSVPREGETKPLEYERRMKEYNLRLQGLTKAQIDNANKPLPTEVIESNWKAISALLQGRTL